MKPLETEVSYFENFLYVKDTSITKIIQTIKDGFWEKQVAQIREAKAKGDSSWEAMKKKLPGFTPSGTFNKARDQESIKQYSRVIDLDIDKLPDTDAVEKLRIDVNSDNYTFTSFVSPSGLGLKVFVKVMSNFEHHALAYNQVAEYYRNKFSVTIDTTGKDFTRLCYISSDKDTFLNEGADEFSVDVDIPIEIEGKAKGAMMEPIWSRTGINVDNQFQKVIDLTLKKESFFKGNRNNFVRLLSGNCNRWGIPEEDALRLILASEYNYDSVEVTDTNKSAYKKFADFNKYPRKDREVISIDESEITAANFDTSPLCHSAKGELGYLYPYLPDYIFEQLPEPLQLASNVFEDKRKRDIFFTAALGVLSGCFPNISGRYGNEEMFSNLYVFVTAPPGNGKSALRYAMDIALKYENLLESESSIDESKPRKMLFVPGNSSAAAVMVHLNENEGSGIFFETEADSLSNALKNEWGNYDDLLRKSFQHEPCSQSRRTENELIKVKQPKLSVVLSGTPDQVQSLTNSVKNGLFSRFLFYSFNRKSVWEDQSPNNNPKSYNEIFADFGNMFFDIIVKYRKYKAIKFKLTEAQWVTLNEVQSGVLTSVSDDFDGEADSIIIRLGLIWFRIAMILTILRSADKFEGDSELVCDDLDFNLAKALIDVYKHHNLEVFESMPKQPKQHQDFKLINFLNKLPSTKFKRDEAVNIASKIGFSKRTADRMLPALVSKSMLIKTEFGYYEKVIEK